MWSVVECGVLRTYRHSSSAMQSENTELSFLPAVLLVVCVICLTKELSVVRCMMV